MTHATMNAILMGKPDARNPHVRFSESSVFGLVLGLVVGVFGVVSTAEGRVVHDASAALRAAADARANPYTDAKGATWAVYARDLPNDGTTSLMAGQAVVTATPSAKGIGVYDNWCFVVGTAESEEKPISGLGSGAVRPGDIVYHPSGEKRVALRFTPPRNGYYSMSAQFYTINPGNNGTVDVTVLLNGATMIQQSVAHNNGVSSSSEVCAFENVLLTTADSLEFVVGPGFREGNGCDSTALSLSIVEEKKADCETLTRYSANEVVATMLGGESPVNPYTDDTGAKWSLIASPWDSWRINNDTTDWLNYHIDDSTLLMVSMPGGWGGCPAVTNKEDWCRIGVNASGACVELDNCLVGKNEIEIHPGQVYSPMIRFTVSTRGTYLVTAVAHHALPSDQVSGRDGIVVGLMAGGDQIAWGNFFGAATSGGVVQAQTTMLEPGETIDCMVHRGENFYSDSSTLGLTIIRLDDASWKGHDIGAAVTAQFKDKAVTTGSFVDANGGTWSTGWTTGFDDAPVPFTQTGSLNDGNLQGVTYDGATSWNYLLANMTGAPLPGWFNTTYLPHISYTRQREIVFHPGADKNPTLRFKVPSHGYYNLTYHVRDIQPHNYDSKGVVMTVTTNGVLLSYCWAGWWNDNTKYDCESSIRLRDIYLKPSDVIDFRLNCDGNNGCDLTALRGWIVPSGKKDDIFKPGVVIMLR